MNSVKSLNIDNFGKPFNIDYALNRIKTMNETEIQNILAEQLFNYKIYTVLPNIYFGSSNHECDLIVVSKNGIVSEIEIKRSISDLKNDKNKRHHRFTETKIHYKYFCIPEFLYEKALEHIPSEYGIITINARRDDLIECWGSNPVYLTNRIGLPSGSIYAKIVRKPKPNKNCKNKISHDSIVTLLHLAMYRVWMPRCNITEYQQTQSHKDYLVELHKSYERYYKFRDKARDTNTREYKYVYEIFHRKEK